MNLSNTTRKYIVMGLVIIIVLGLFLALVMGKKQDKIFKADADTYNLVIQQLQEGNYEAALEEVETLVDSRQKSSVFVNQVTGILALNSGEIEKGILHFQRVLDMNPYMVEDSLFMLQLAEAFVVTGQNKEAAIVLERCQTLAIPDSYPEYLERVTELQEQINTQL